MFLWLSVIDKKVAHPHEIQNTFVEGTKVTLKPFNELITMHEITEGTV